MPVLFMLRALFTILSVAILVAALYLLGDWYIGEPVRGADGIVRLHRDAWELWVGAALAVWSVLGRFPALLLLARKDTDRMHATRHHGRMVPSSTGATLYVENDGQAAGRPIILTHGWSMDSTIWYYARRDLGAHSRVVAWDLPGLGRSKRADASISMSGYAEDLKTILAYTGGERPVLVGHSIGGMMIETLARDDPAFFARHVAGVVLLNTTYTNPLKTMILSGLFRALKNPVLVPMMYMQIWLTPLVWLLQWQSYLSGSQHVAVRFGFGRSVTRSQLDHTALLMTRNSPAVVARGDLAMIRWDGSAGLPQIGVPTLVIAGDIDIVTKLEASETITRAIPDATLSVAGGANHMGPIEQAERYNRTILDFVATLDRS